jgi:hypothetical protein
MKFEVKKGYLITIIILVLMIILAYKIRHRPIDNLNSYLERTYPNINSNEAKRACDDFKIDVKKLLKFVLQKGPLADSSAVQFVKSNNLQTLLLTSNEMYKKYHITDKNDQVKVTDYIGNSMQYEIDMALKYLGKHEKRNFLEKYFYFDF